ncbi:hypothetical protein [Methyloceanibacter methanicus]|uniref:hypothetical protein n=1 Tax=Methyloceanibacter methanicus TaxID=1774968 RepID=UPI0013016EE3|nr:hypothetical protein [Methyloceanibacter methanicus]
MPLDDSLPPARHAPVQSRVLGVSLLRASTAQRLVLVAAMLSVLWLAVLWALQ